MGHEDTSDPYRLLGVGPGASTSEIRVAFRRAARRAHPDAGGDPVRFVALRRAFETLTDPSSRAAVDAVRASGPVDSSVNTPPPNGATWATDTVDGERRAQGGGADRRRHEVAAVVRVRWPALTVAWRWTGGPLLHVGSVGLVVGRRDGDTLDGLDPTSGERRWSAGLGAAATSSPVWSGSALVVSTDDGVVHGLDPTSGVTRWTRRLTEAATTLVAAGGNVLAVGTETVTAVDAGGGVVWAVRPAGGVLGAVPAGPVVAIGTGSGTVVGIDPRSGVTRWWLRRQAPWPVQPVVVGGSLWLPEPRRDPRAPGRSGAEPLPGSAGPNGGAGDVVVGVDPRTGAATHTLHLPDPLLSMHEVGSLSVLRDVVGGLTAVASGRPRWRVIVPTQPSTPALIDGCVAVASADGVLRFVTASDGHEVHQVPLGDLGAGPVSVAVVDGADPAGGASMSTSDRQPVVIVGVDGGALVHRRITPTGEPTPR